MMSKPDEPCDHGPDCEGCQEYQPMPLGVWVARFSVDIPGAPESLLAFYPAMPTKEEATDLLRRTIGSSSPSPWVVLSMKGGSSFNGYSLRVRRPFWTLAPDENPEYGADLRFDRVYHEGRKPGAES